jgi:hypothetical protein
MRKIGAIALVVLTGLLIWAVQSAPSKTVLHLPLTKTVSINNPYPMTFVPPPGSARPTIRRRMRSRDIGPTARTSRAHWGPTPSSSASFPFGTKTAVS